MTAFGWRHLLLALVVTVGVAIILLFLLVLPIIVFQHYQGNASEGQ